MKKKAADSVEALAPGPVVGDIYAVRSERYERWALYQIIRHDHEGLGVVALEGFEERVPTERELGGLKPLVIQRYSWRPHPDVFLVSDTAMPRHFVRLGHAPPCFQGKIDSYAMGLPSPGSLTAEEEYRWMRLSPSVREAYKRALNTPERITTASGERLNNTTRTHVEAHTPFDWSELDPLPMLTTLTVSGKAEGLLAYCIGRPLIHDLHWSDTGAKTLDFSATQLRELTLDIAGVERIILGEETDRLCLVGEGGSLDTLRIEQPGSQGRYCELELSGLKAQLLPQFQLPALSELRVRCDELDVERIVQAYPQLESLTVFGNPGAVKNLASMRELPRLRRLMLVDMFGFGAADVPPAQAMPALESIWISSVPKSAGQWIKKEYGHIPELNIRKLRDESWLEINARNPFRAWDGRDGITPAHAAKAFEAYKKLAAAVQKLSPGDDSTPALLKLTEDFTLTFNKMCKKSSLETMEREEVGEVLSAVVKPFPAAVQSAALEAFDRVRDF